jgi:hypothetical protein
MTFRVRPVAVCVAVTVTPGSTLPLGSRTVPAIEAVDTACANAIDALRNATTKPPRRHRPV